MKGGAENRKKTITAGVLGAGALIALYILYNSFFGGPSTPPPAPPVAAAPATSTTTSAPVAAKSSSTATTTGTNTGLGAAPGIEAKKMASTSASLDPTLDESAMLRTEGLVYAGTGRNIFSATYVPPVAEVKNVPSARPVPTGPPPPPPGPPPPPPPPPINLKFFGVYTVGTGKRQAFLLSGEDVYLASMGDIVARKYKILTITATSIQVEDLTNNNTQTLPLQMN
jgi:hypothetical protein